MIVLSYHAFSSSMLTKPVADYSKRSLFEALTSYVHTNAGSNQVFTTSRDVYRNLQKYILDGRLTQYINWLYISCMI